MIKPPDAHRARLSNGAMAVSFYFEKRTRYKLRRLSTQDLGNNAYRLEIRAVFIQVVAKLYAADLLMENRCFLT